MARECTNCGEIIPLGESHPSLCGQAAANEALRQRLIAGFEMSGCLDR
jgi:hypothetical protein